MAAIPTERSGRYFRDINSLAQWMVPDHDTVFLVLARDRDPSRSKQEDRAAVMVDGDILLSFVKGASCWTGVSLVWTNRTKGHTRPLNPVESVDAWSSHFGAALDVVSLFQLFKPEQAFLTSNAELGLAYHGRGIYTQMQQRDDCARIASEIERAAGQSPEAIRDSADEVTARRLEEFCRQWRHTLERDPYLTEIAVARSRGRCAICGVTAPEWVHRLQTAQPEQSYRNVFDDAEHGYAFLEVHHDLPRSVGGDARLENLLALCPNCHRVVSRNIDALHEDEKRASESRCGRQSRPSCSPDRRSSNWPFGRR